MIEILKNIYHLFPVEFWEVSFVLFTFGITLIVFGILCYIFGEWSDEDDRKY